MTTRRSTLARPLALWFAGLVVYASWYPFDGWLPIHAFSVAFLSAPWPRYWTAFDLWSNLLGYAPLGALLALWVLRTRGGRWAWVGAVLAPALLSLGLELGQVLLPSRVPSNVDWALNTLGGWAGLGVACVGHRRGWWLRWDQVRAHWFVPGAHGALVLLALWPFAVLYPAGVPLGLGQVWPALQQALSPVLAAIEGWAWSGLVVPQPQPLSDLTQSAVVVFSGLAPVLLGYSVVPTRLHRLWHLVGVLALGLAVCGLSASLTYGPAHAWSWWSEPVERAWWLLAFVGLLLLPVPLQAARLGLVVCLMASLWLLNRAPPTPYLVESIEVWAQGRFIRFHGLTQWLGWAWPFVALAHGWRQWLLHRA